MSSMLLEAKEVHTYYGASHILHGIDFHIRQGEGIALMGRNGMGKTTLIKSMLGIVRPRHGRHRACPRDVMHLHRPQIARQPHAHPFVGQRDEHSIARQLRDRRERLRVAVRLIQVRLGNAHRLFAHAADREAA
mgnify:CR=1 FL=1